MRQTLENIIKDTIIIKATLDSTKRSSISSVDDHCLESLSDENLKKIIYEWIIEYSYNEFEIIEKDINILHRNALSTKLKYDHNATQETQEKYWFYGEILLDWILKVLFWTNCLISRGYFYNPLENSETKWFDCYHLISNDDQLYLYYGETKFHQNAKSWITDVLNKIENSLSNQYLEKNLLALVNHKEKIIDWTIWSIINRRQEEWLNLIQTIQDNHIILVYPILIIGNYIKQDYNENIEEQVKHIESLLPKTISLSIQYEIFFIFLPVYNTQDIKQTIIEWISSNKALEL